MDPARTCMGPHLYARAEEKHEGSAVAHLNLYWEARMCTRIQEFWSFCGFTSLDAAQIYFEFVAILASCGQKILFANVAPGRLSPE